MQDRGTELPVAEMCRLAREQGAFVYFDGGQAVGQLDVDIAAIDPDFYAVLGYKWMLGPMVRAVSTWPNACATCCRFPGPAATWLST